MLRDVPESGPAGEPTVRWRFPHLVVLFFLLIADIGAIAYLAGHHA